jgi:ligand-binding sensor domain-containing protein
MPLIYIPFLIISCVLSLNLLAQQPSFIRAGEDIFKDKDIYSLVQADDHTIWISTNLGLLQYDGYQFKTYTNAQAKSNALFNLQKNYHGQIYCYNLNGQIFRVENDSLHLHYEIPDSLISNQFEYSFDDQNRLFIAAKSFFYLDTQKHPQIIYDLSNSTSVSRREYI